MMLKALNYQLIKLRSQSQQQKVMKNKKYIPSNLYFSGFAKPKSLRISSDLIFFLGMTFSVAFKPAFLRSAVVELKNRHEQLTPLLLPDLGGDRRDDLFAKLLHLVRTRRITCLE